MLNQINHRQISLHMRPLPTPYPLLGGDKGWGAANKMIALVGESPTLTIVRSGQVVISGIEGGNNLYESPEVNGQSARQEA